MSKGLQLGSLGGVQYPNLSQRDDRKDRAALLSQEDPNSEAETVDRFVRWRVLFVLLNIAACITCSVIALQLSWRHSHYLEALSPAVDNLKTAISVLTLLMVIQMTEMAWYRHINSPEYLQDPEDQSALGFLASIDFWLEIGVCLLHCPPPWVWHSAPEEWNLFVLARCYWLVRFFYLFSSVYRDRRKVQLLVQSHDAYLSGPQEGGVHLAPAPFNYSTMAKVYFTEHAWSLLFWSTIVVFLTLSYAVYVCERAEQPELFTYGNSVYFTATMVTTIGSSLQPNHPIGRLLSLIASLFGVAFLSLSVVVLLDTLRLQGDMELACMDMFSLIKTERRNQTLADARKSKLAA